MLKLFPNKTGIIKEICHIYKLSPNRKMNVFEDTIAPAQILKFSKL